MSEKYEFYFYKIDGILVEIPKKVYNNFNTLKYDNYTLKTIYKNNGTKHISLNDIDYSKILKIELPFPARDGDLYSIKDSYLVLCFYDFNKKSFVIQDYFTNKRFDLIRSLNRLKEFNSKELVLNLNTSSDLDLFTNTVRKVIETDLIPEAINHILSMKKFNYLSDENWEILQLNLIKEKYESKREVEIRGEITTVYQGLTNESKDFISKNLYSDLISNNKKIDILRKKYC